MNEPSSSAFHGWITRRALIAAFLSLIAGAADPASARVAAPLVHPGARVRVFVADTTRAASRTGEPTSGGAVKSERLIASFVEFGDESITIRRQGRDEPSTIPLEHIHRLEVSEERKSRAGGGARIGLLAGIGGGIIAGLIVCDDGECEEAESGTDFTAVVSTVLGLGGGLVGAGLGALTGSFFHSERWAAVPLPNARFGLRSPGRGEMRVGLTLPF